MNTTAQQKAELRKRALAARATLDPAAAGAALANVVLQANLVPAGAVVAGVWPLPGELDLRLLLHALHARHHTILLPHTPPLGGSLVFRLWTPGCPMLRERFGTYRPDGPIATPDLIFVPLLAFDLHGSRLGYGGGYYDRTLAALPDAGAIGFAYAAQCVDAVPVEKHDRALDAVVTEERMFFFEKKNQKTFASWGSPVDRES